jgi:tetratricopeptide (TPR) repeat protein
MKPESIFFTIAGMCFGVIVGWVLASVDLSRERSTAPPVQAAASGERGPALDEARVQALTTILTNDPNNAGAAVQLAGTYFEAERYDDAVKWYQEALRIDPKNVEASTQLGMTYFFTQGADPALAQLDRSLEMSPNHPLTLLNKGIVLWRGKQDKEGAGRIWKQLIDVAPNSPEAEAAKTGLGALAGAPAGGAAAPQNGQ